MIRILAFVIKYKIFVVAALLTLVLCSMVYSRISILQSGKEIVLLSRPIDPRDLFRGHYVTLFYRDASSLDSCKVDMPGKLARGQPVFVQFEEGKEGYWKAVSVSARPLKSTGTTIILSGYNKYRFQALTSTQPSSRKPSCPKLRVRYGLEKYFAPKKRAQELENIRRGRNPETDKKIREMSKEVGLYRKKIRDISRQQRKSAAGLRISRKPASAELARLREKISALQKRITATRNEGRAKVAVIVRVSRSGEGVISGLMVDGKKVYDEPLL